MKQALLSFWKQAHRRRRSELLYPYPRPLDQPRRVAVVGAGFAGAMTAFRLAQKGVDVTVFDRGEELGSAASGNWAGLAKPLVTSVLDRLSALSWLGLELWGQWGLVERLSDHWPLGLGLAVWGYDQDETKKLYRAQQGYLGNELLGQEDGAGRDSGGEKALFRMPRGFRVRPKLVLRELLGTSRVVSGVEVLGWEIERQQTLLYGRSVGLSGTSEVLGAPFDAVVWCHAPGTSNLREPELQTELWASLGLERSNLKVLRGQITLHPWSDCPLDQSKSQWAGHCFHGYGLELAEGYLLGASYKVEDFSDEPRREEWEPLQRSLSHIDPGLASQLRFESAKVRVARRLMARDRAPLAGALRDPRCEGSMVSYNQNHFILTALGSRGLLSAAVGARLIEQQMFGPQHDGWDEIFGKGIWDELCPHRFWADAQRSEHRN